MSHHEQDINDLGLAADLNMLIRSHADRRRILKLGAVGVVMLLTGGLGARAKAAPPAQADCTTIPAETAGPYPADGSSASGQTLNVLTRSGVVRQDIRPSLSTATVADGVPCSIELTLANVNGSCAPVAGYAVYIWHCDRLGRYSMYTSGVTNEDYLRGVQAAGADGKVTFTTIFPGCYAGRWPHVHFEVYPSLAQATGPANIIHTSQLAIPREVCEQVYALPTYPSSAQNLSRITLQSDNVFGNDGGEHQIATVSGNVSDGYLLQLTVGVHGAEIDLSNKLYLPALSR
ncbi:MAG TPA: intradiol ring-cleavage dioxygenase [Herpetosiphonaceae bacterium]